MCKFKASKLDHIYTFSKFRIIQQKVWDSWWGFWWGSQICPSNISKLGSWRKLKLPSTCLFQKYNSNCEKYTSKVLFTVKIIRNIKYSKFMGSWYLPIWSSCLVEASSTVSHVSFNSITKVPWLNNDKTKDACVLFAIRLLVILVW